VRAERYEVGLIGAGIAGSLSPPLHEREASELDLDYAYRLIEIDGHDVGDVLDRARRAGFRGVNVTHPCKQAVVEHLDAMSADASALQAVNTVVFEDGRTTGHNTDTTGFAESFARGLPDAGLRHVVLLGAGGAGSAVGLAALRLGAERLTIVDVDREQAEACADRLGVEVGTVDSVRAADGLIHATPTGMEAHPGLPLDESLLHPALWVADVVYRPLATPLLQRAREIGCRTLDGGGMAVFQAADAFELFTGVAPDRERMLRHFAALAEHPVEAG
jgi:shikimate dehydrogenase